MRVLLDTHALYWLLGGSPRLGARARSVVANAAELVVSDISLLEISIKVSLGKLPRVPSLHASMSDFERTRIEPRFLDRLEVLPWHHRDPFDRLLIAQALSDDLTVLTADPVFAQYGVRVLNAES